MKRRAIAIAVAVGSALAFPLASPVAAQQSIHLGLAGGAVFPVGKLDSTYTSGPSGLITLSFAPSDAPLGFRLDYQYDGLKGKTIGSGRVQNIHVNSVTGNIVVPFRVGYAKPYIIGGAGLYPLRLPGASKRENDWGANGGAGIGFPLPYTTIGAFIEVRYHAITRPNTASYHFIPVTLGVLF